MQHASIQFTLEEENNETLPFMDIRVERLGNGHLQTSVYRKPTHTGRYLNFESNHPPSVKRSVVKSLISRTEYVSRNDGKEEEAHKITVDLLANNYPRNFIRQQEQRKQSQHTQATRSTEPVKATACIPYVEGPTQAIRRILSSVNIRTVSRSNSLKWTLMKGAKD